MRDHIRPDMAQLAETITGDDAAARDRLGPLHDAAPKGSPPHRPSGPLWPSLLALAGAIAALVVMIWVQA